MLLLQDVIAELTYYSSNLQGTVFFLNTKLKFVCEHFS